EPVDVPEQAKGSGDPAFVRQVGGVALVGDEGPVDLHAAQRPRSGADEDRLWVAEGNSGDRRTRVVGGGCDDRRPVEGTSFDRAKLRSWLDDVLQDPGGAL